MDLMFATWVFTLTSFLSPDCPKEVCNSIERNLLDGSVLSATEIKLTQNKKAYHNPEVTLDGLTLPVADSFLSDGSQPHRAVLCGALSKGELTEVDSLVKSRNGIENLLEGSGWKRQDGDHNPYDFEIARAFFLRGDSYEWLFKGREDGDFFSPLYTSSMADSYEVLSTVTCKVVED